MATVITRANAVQAIASRITRSTDIVLIDGRSGSGKTTIGTEVYEAVRLRGIPVRLVHIERIYQGWDGLEAAAEAVASGIAEPLSQGRSGVWDEWDWERERVIASHTVVFGAPIIVEGVGALHPRSAAAATLRIWVEADDALRQERAIARDGDTYRPHWERWAAQEEAFIAQHSPRHLADLIVDTNA